MTHAEICLRNDAAGWVSGLEARTGGIVIGRAHSHAAAQQPHLRRVPRVTARHVLLGEAKAAAVADGGGGLCGTISAIIAINALPLRTPGHVKCNLLAVLMTRERHRFHPDPLAPVRVVTEERSHRAT